jgi:hypothetical protein
MMKKNGEIWNYVEIDQKLDPDLILGIKWGAAIGFNFSSPSDD